MIISNIIGGLGNQMFQYACGRALSLRTKQSLQISTDQFDSYALHNGFELTEVFNLNPTVISNEDLKKILGWKAMPVVRRLFGKKNIDSLTGVNWINENNFHKISSRPLDPVYLHGYWQSEIYFSDFSDLIRTDFTFRKPISEKDLEVSYRMAAQPSASLHIRRGDYIKNQNIYALCSIDYYRTAIRLLRNRVPSIRFFAFSDDPDWVSKYLMDEKNLIEIVSHNNGLSSANDMRLMSQADHHIIANSSFSWWGAWLNPSQSKIIVAPKHWFSNGNNDGNLIPSTWLRI